MDMVARSSVLTAETTGIGRVDDLKHILGKVVAGQCCSVVGVSNIGKSVLMRTACRPEVWSSHAPKSADHCVPLYMDLNFMLEMTERGFYEFILRTIRGRVESGADGLQTRISAAYERLISSPQDSLASRVAFEEALTAFVTQQERRPILFFDEFDEVFASLSPQVFLNLRAFRDQYRRRLTYVAATGRPLNAIRSGRGVGEFSELFAHHTYYLPPLKREDSRLLVDQIMQAEDATLVESQTEVILDATGGHPGLLRAACHVTARAMRSPSWILERPRFHEEHLIEALESSPSVRAECTKLWEDLSLVEQEAFLSLLPPAQIPSQDALRPLRKKHLVRQDAVGPVPFCTLFALFVKRQRLARSLGPRGVKVDVDSGDVYVDGTLIPPLTELEYRLMLLLYGRLNRICDKYSVVESVWGEEYIDEVDDARIEKLVSRLRAKIEPDPSHPRYLLTVRGRGYRLVSE